jgi:hypothetical protein
MEKRLEPAEYTEKLNAYLELFKFFTNELEAPDINNKDRFLIFIEECKDMNIIFNNLLGFAEDINSSFYPDFQKNDTTKLPYDSSANFFSARSAQEEPVLEFDQAILLRKCQTAFTKTDPWGLGCFTNCIQSLRDLIKEQPSQKEREELENSKNLLNITLNKIQTILNKLKNEKDAFILFESIIDAKELLVTTCLEQVETIKGLYNKEVDLYEKYRNAMHFIKIFNFKFNLFLSRKMMPSGIPLPKIKTIANLSSVKQPSVKQPSARVVKNKVENVVENRQKKAFANSISRIQSVKTKGGKKNATKRNRKTMRPKKSRGAKSRRKITALL